MGIRNTLLRLDLSALEHVSGLLSAAPEGSRQLDYLLAVCCGLLSPKGLEVLRKGRTASVMESVSIDNAVPAMTTSLDASMPWEDIVSVSRNAGIYTAACRDCYSSRGDDSVTMFGTGATEAIARRSAALKVLVGKMKRMRSTPVNLVVLELVCGATD